jgi:hypothetical protein
MMKTKTTLLTAIAAIAISGCVGMAQDAINRQQEAIASVRPGMTEAQVIQDIGRPANVATSGGLVQWQYDKVCYSAGPIFQRSLYIHFSGGVVTNVTDLGCY